MALNLEQANQLITDTFPDNWWEAFDFHKSATEVPDFTPQITRFKEKLVLVENRLFDFLNFSIFTGEYCQENNFESDLGDLKSKLDSINPTSILPPENIQAVLQKSLREDFIEPLKLAMNFYAEFHSNVKAKIRLSTTEYILSYHEEIIDVLGEKRYDKNSRENLNFLSANIYVARCDHFITYEGDEYKLLFTLARDLTKGLNVNKPYAHVLRLKCRFLLAKTLIRKRKESEVPVYILKNAVEEEFSVQEFDTEETFRTEYDYILTHYEIKTGWKTYVGKDFEAIRQKGYSNMSVRELHRAIKYFKDVNPSIECLKDIRAELQSRFNKARDLSNHADFYAYAIALNYNINNEFSLLCDKPNTSEEKVDALYKEIIHIQKTTGVRNFFPQTKYLNFLLDKLNSYYEKKKALEFVGPCREIIRKCEELFELYKQNVEWSTLNYNYVFQLPHEECHYETKSDDVPKLFVFSSFLMPLPRRKYEEEFDSNQTEVFNMSSSIDVFENVTNEFDELKKLKADLKLIQDEVKNKEIRTLEVLGIFTAIVTFVASSIPTFKFVGSGAEAFLFMFALACSLGIFVLLLLTINRGIEAFKKNRIVIYPLMAMAIIVWILVFVFVKGNPNEGKQSIEKEQVIPFPSMTRPNNSIDNISDTLTVKSKPETKQVK